MSALTGNLLSPLMIAWAPAAVFVASLLGSAHCVGMCGGLVTSLCPTRGHLIRYHFGRLLAYTSLGIGAGAVGHSMFSASTLNWLSWSAALLMAAAFALMGVQIWKGKSLHFQILPKRVLHVLYRHADRAPIALGALSAALPCGWLQSFVLAAAATRSAPLGGMLMASFWLGTLPALTATPWLTRRVLKPASSRAPKLTAVFLIVAGLWGIGFKMTTLFAADGNPHCHCELEKAGKP